MKYSKDVGQLTIWNEFCVRNLLRHWKQKLFRFSCWMCIKNHSQSLEFLNTKEIFRETGGKASPIRNSALDWDERSASRFGRFTYGEITHGTNWVGGWLGSETGLVVVVVKSEVQPIRNQSLCWLSCPISYKACCMWSAGCPRLTARI